MTTTMKGRLSECILLSYSVPRESVQALVPSGLELVTHEGQAFWNIVVSTIDKMRPQAMPKWTGITYHHIAYRLQVAAKTESGAIDGLFFLRSDVSSSLIGTTGNWLSDFKLHTSKINIDEQEQRLDVEVQSRESVGNALLSIDTSANQARIQTGLFRDANQEEAILKYQPFGLAVGRKGQLRLAEVIRDETAWSESRVAVLRAQWSFFDAESQGQMTLQRATRVAPLAYRWRLGRTAKLPGRSA